MAEINPCSWLQNAGATHTASQMRMSVGSLLGGVSDESSSLTTRGGVQPSLGDRLIVTQTGAGNLSVSVGSGIVYVPGTFSFTQGTYVCINDNPVVRAVAGPDGSLDRLDAVVAEVHDDFYDTGGVNEWEISVVTGTADADPQLPDLPESSLLLAEVLVRAATVSVLNSDITDSRVYISIGIISVADQAERDALVNPYDGLAVWLRDSQFLDIRSVGEWIGINRPPAAVSVHGQLSQLFSNFNTIDFEPTSPALEITFIAPDSGKGKIEIFTRLDADDDDDRADWDVEVRRDNSAGSVLHTPSSETGGGSWFWRPAFPANANFVHFRYLEGMVPGATYWAQLQFDTLGTNMDIADQLLLYVPIYY